MRNWIYLTCLLLLFTTCKKNNDQSGPAVIKTDWNAELKKTVWNAEIQYTDVPLLIPQYASIVFGNDNTATIYDMRIIHSYTWSVADSTITLDEYGRKRKADVGKTAWKNFENSSSFEFNIFSVTKAEALDPVALVGTVWKGSFYGGNLLLEFLPATSLGNTVRITHSKVNGGTPYTTSYSTFGSGILFGSPLLGVPTGISYFGCLYNNEIKGLGYQTNLFQLYWKVTKQ